MSGPAVVIGFILLIPSVLGMVTSALTFFEVIAYHGDESRETFDSSFRRTCLNSAAKSYRQRTGASASLPILETYCECTLPLIKEGRSAPTAVQECGQQMQDGLLTLPDQETQNLYADAMGRSGQQSSQRIGLAYNDAGIRLFHWVGGGFAIFWLIAFFVSGLLGCYS